MPVCLLTFDSPAFRGLKTLGQRVYAYIGIPLDILGFCCFADCFVLNFLGFWVFANQPTLDVAVGVSYR